MGKRRSQTRSKWNDQQYYDLMKRMEDRAARRHEQAMADHNADKPPIPPPRRRRGSATPEDIAQAAHDIFGCRYFCVGDQRKNHALLSSD